MSRLKAVDAALSLTSLGVLSINVLDLVTFSVQLVIDSKNENNAS